jgi:hypothetical protein
MHVIYLTYVCELVYSVLIFRKDGEDRASKGRKLGVNSCGKRSFRLHAKQWLKCVIRLCTATYSPSAHSKSVAETDKYLCQDKF